MGIKNRFKEYHDHFNLYKAKGKFMKLFFIFMLSLPHILSCFLLVLFFPKQWILIFIIGLLLPDFSYFIQVVLFPMRLNRSYKFSRVRENMKLVAHFLTFVVIIFLLINKEFVLFLSGGIHLFLDFLGF